MAIGPVATVSNDEAELVALGLAIRSFQQRQNLNPSLRNLSIFRDSQSAIRKLHYPTNSKSNQYMADTLQKLLRRSPYPTNLKLFWVPGHEGIELNETADTKAKEAALSDSQDIKLDTSLSALRRTIKASFKPSPEIFNTDKPILFKTPPQKIWSALAKLEKGRASVIFQLQSGHIALNAYLYRFSRNNSILSPNCEICRVPETVDHFLTRCKRYKAQRNEFRQALKKQKIKVNFYNSSKLIDHPEAFFLLSEFVFHTNQFTHFKVFLHEPDD